MQPRRLLLISVAAVAVSACAPVPGATESPSGSLREVSTPVVMVSAPASVEPEPTASRASLVGINWTPATIGDRRFAIGDGVAVTSALAWSGGYLLGGDADGGTRAQLWVSGDGHDWTALGDAGGAFAGSVLGTLVAMPRGVLAVGTSSQLDALCEGGEGSDCNPVSPIRLWTSTDGRHWMRLPESVTRTFGRTVIISVADGPRGVVVFGWRTPARAADPQVPALWTSPDGRTWSAAPQFARDFPGGVMETIAWFAGQWVAVGRTTGPGGSYSGGAAWTSPDGTTWLKAALAVPSDSEPSGLAVGTDGIVTVDDRPNHEPTMWRSSDGETWSPVAADALPFLVTVGSPTLTSNGSSIYALGMDRDGATGVWTSRDGVSWQPVSVVGVAPETGAPPVAAGDRRGLVVIGASGVWLASLAP